MAIAKSVLAKLRISKLVIFPVTLLSPTSNNNNNNNNNNNVDITYS